MITRRKKRKGRPKITSKKTKIGEIPFDSQTEARYYKKLLANTEVKHIELQPVYQIIEPFEVECKRCRGVGKILNENTGRLNKCSLCNGNGKRTKQGAIYTADFKVTYQDGYQEVIDVKGYANDSFALRQKLFESVTGLELIVVSQDNKTGEWVRK
ncbi:DUF1064 domain-containing protein [Chryseomicrobium palamuruense]